MDAFRKWLFRLFLFEIARTQIKPDDILVIRFIEYISLAEQQRFTEDIKTILPESSVIFLNSGASLEIVHKEGDVKR